MDLKSRAYHLLQPATEREHRASRALDLLIVTLILISLVAVVLESEPSLRRSAPWLFRVSELVIASLFGIEYVVRLWSITVDPRYAHPVWGRLRFALTPMALIDLLAFFPSLVLRGLLDLRMLRLLRIARLARVLKLARYSRAVSLIQRTLVRQREELVLSFLLVLVLMLIASSLLYVVEQHAQPEHFGTIPRAMWWSVITLTTVGYGDVYPMTTLGRVLASGIAVLGVGMVALPTGIIGAGFVEEIRQDRLRAKGQHHCPHCGEYLSASRSERANARD